MYHQGNIHWFHRDELGNGIQSFPVVATKSMAGHDKEESSVAFWQYMWSWLTSLMQISPWPHFVSSLQKEPQTTISGVVPLRFLLVSTFMRNNNPNKAKPGNNLLHAKPIYNRAQVKGEKVVWLSTNYIIKILYSALTFFSVVWHMKIIQLAIASTHFSSTCWIF